VVSVPVSYFNNSGGWKAQFTNPAYTFVVALVEYHNASKDKVELCILGAQQGPDEVFNITSKTYIVFRALWVAHGGRMQPSYEYQKIPTTVHSSDSPVPLTKKPSGQV
jgi:hypothetical protein